MANPKSRNGKRNFRNRNKNYDRSGNKMQSRENPSQPEEKESPTNDPSWYAVNQTILDLTAGVNFSYPAGSRYTRNVAFGSVVSNANGWNIIPGLYTMRVVPVPGDSPDFYESPVNVAAKAMYAKVRATNSGSSSYNAPDLMLYAMALGNVYSYINWLQRVYGALRSFNAFTKYTPEMLAYANSVAYNDVTRNIRDFAGIINLLIDKAAQFACPGDMPYFSRLAFLFSGIYIEGESIKDQMYMLVPDGFMVYDENTNPQGGQLTFKPLFGTGSVTEDGVSGLLTVDELYAYGNQLLSPIIGSDDMKNISGDVLKAYQSNIIRLSTMPEELRIAPVTDLNVLEQIQNADYVGGRPTTMSVVQDVDNNKLVCNLLIEKPTIARQLMMSTKNTHLLTTILTEPNAADVMERTRLMFTYEQDATTNTTYHLVATSEICTIAGFWNRATSNGQPNFIEVAPAYTVGGTVNQASMAAAIITHCNLENFKFHPTLHYFRQNGNTETYDYMDAAVDVDNYTLIDNQRLYRINEAAALGLFRIDAIAKVQ